MSATGRNWLWEAVRIIFDREVILCDRAPFDRAIVGTLGGCDLVKHKSDWDPAKASLPRRISFCCKRYYRKRVKANREFDYSAHD